MDNQQLTNKDFFFCYNKNIYRFLVKENGLDYITIAKEPKNNKMFSLFYRSNLLEQKLREYNRLEKTVKINTDISNS